MKPDPNYLLIRFYLACVIVPGTERKARLKLFLLLQIPLPGTTHRGYSSMVLVGTCRLVTAHSTFDIFKCQNTQLLTFLNVKLWRLPKDLYITKIMYKSLGINVWALFYCFKFNPHMCPTVIVGIWNVVFRPWKKKNMFTDGCDRPRFSILVAFFCLFFF